MLLATFLFPAIAAASPIIGNVPGPLESNTITSSTAAFLPNLTAWSDGASTAFSVSGDSCNTTELELIGQGLNRALELVDHARAHLRRFGNDT